MYAVIRSGGKQYKVTSGERIRVPSIPADPGAAVDFEVLALHNGEEVTIGKPVIAAAKVSGKVLEHGRDKKIIVFRFKRRKGYHRKQGHRQGYTDILIENIQTA